MKNSVLVCLLFVLLMACSKSTTHDGQDFVGKWQSDDDDKITIEIKAQVREGQKLADRYDVAVLATENAFYRSHVFAGQFNYQLVTAQPQDNYHPFSEFLHKNTFSDTLPYFGLTENNMRLVCKFKKDIMREIHFKKVE